MKKIYFLGALIGFTSMLSAVITVSIETTSQSVAPGQTVSVVGHAYDGVSEGPINASFALLGDPAVDVNINSVEPSYGVIDNANHTVTWSSVSLNSGDNLFEMSITFGSSPAQQAIQCDFTVDGNTASIGFAQAASAESFVKPVPINTPETYDPSTTMPIVPGTVVITDQPDSGTVSTDGTDITITPGTPPYDTTKKSRGIFTYKFSADLQGVAATVDVTNAALIPYTSAFARYYNEKYAPKVVTNDFSA